MQTRTVHELIQAAGGPKVIALKIGKIDKSGDAVKKWRLNGIPSQYWSALIELIPGATAEEMLAANDAAKDAEAAEASSESAT